MTDELTHQPVCRGLVSREQLAADLRSLGLQRGQDLLIHCSLRQVGRIDGGAATLLNAILEVAGPEATLVVPTHTTLNSLTSRAFLSATAGLDAQEQAQFIAAMPGFDPASTPSTGMGAFAEYLRTHPSAAAAVIPRCPSPRSALARSTARQYTTWAVISVTGHRWAGCTPPTPPSCCSASAIRACTAFHLAEYHLPGTAPRRVYRCFTAEGGKRVEHEFTDIELDDSDFELLGMELESTAERGVLLRRGQVGSAGCRLVTLRTAVDFARSWLAVHRGRAP